MYYKSSIYILIYISCLIVYSYQAAAPDHEACGPLMFNCGNNVCIPRSWRCDGDTDCLNGNDEKSCDTQPSSPQCDEKNFYKCKESSPSSRSTMSELRWRSLAQLFPSSCIPLKWKCDGEFDCPEKDDEDGCNEITCGEGQFKCKGFAHHATSCIPNSWVCDGQSDCVDMSDEKDCGPEDKKVEKCADDEFKCNDGQCIFASWQCDGEFDCKDNSDENENCKNQPCNATTHFQCKNSHFCLPKAWQCDGQGDCPDHSDEANCTDVKTMHPVTCSKDEFKCKNGAECIRNAWVCDGDKDCTDGSDEVCTDSARKCGVDETLCPDNICRESCETTSPKPDIQVCNTEKSYKCNDTSCIPLHRLCNDNLAINDCLKTVCDKEILQCNPADNPYCNCRDTTKGGKICYCPSGFEKKGGSCVDINECDEPGTCDQKCTNLVGTYKCDCYPGFQLTGGKTVDGDGISHPASKCRAVGDDPLLFLSNRAAIRQYDLVTNKYHPLVNKLDSAVAMDYWHKNRTLIWSDVSKEQIVICQMHNKTNIFECDDGKNQILIDKNISTPDGLAVDWVHGLLFWTDTGLDSINVYDLVNNKRRVLFNTSLEEPRAIAVDPTAGLIFWTDWGTQKIERAGMDGKDRVEVISGETVRWPNGLAVDIYDQRIYWADAKTKAISSCDYWGKDVRTILHSHEYLKHPFSLTVFEERLYWTDWDHEGVLTVNKFKGDDVKTVMHGVPGPMTVRIFHQMAQPNHTNKCDLHQCDHLCLPRAHIRKSNVHDEESIKGLPYSCGCDMGFELSGLTKCLPENGLIDVLAQEITGDSNSSDHALFIFFICGLIVSGVLVTGYVYRQKRFARFSALNFDNPIYRRTIEEGNEFDNDNSVGAIPVNPASASQEPRLILSNSVTAQYNREQAAYMDNDPLNDRRGIY
jgi:hypothetical protein